MDNVSAGVLSSVIGAAVTALFFGSEYHAVARTSSGYISLCLLSVGAFVLTIVHTSSPTYRDLMQRRELPFTPLARWTVLGIMGAVIFSLGCGGVFTQNPGWGSFCLGIAVGRGVGWMCGAPQKPTTTARRLLVGFGIVLVALWLGRSTIRSTLVPFAERDAAQVTVQKAAVSGSVWTLKRALTHREPRVRRDAAVALGHLGPDAKAAIPALIKTLRAEGDTYRQWEVAETRQAAAMALGHIGPTAESAVPALIEALQDKSNGAIFLRPAAATALGEIGQPVEQVVPTLTGFLRGRTIRDLEIEPAVCALGRIGPGSEPAIPTLLDLLESQPTTQTEAIRRALVDIGPAAMKAVATRCDRLLNEIGQTDMAARVGAGMTLRKMGPLALPPIERSLKNDNARVRIGAARAVVWLDAELQTATLSSLSGLLGDPDMSVQWEALQSLAEIGPRAKPAVAAVIELLKSDDANDRLRNLASWALKQIDPDVGIPPEQGDNRDGNPNSDGTDTEAKKR